MSGPVLPVLKTGDLDEKRKDRHTGTRSRNWRDTEVKKKAFYLYNDKGGFPFRRYIRLPTGTNATKRSPFRQCNINRKKKTSVYVT